MTLDVKGIVYGGLNVQESLGRAWRFEPLLFAFPSSHWLMRVFRTIIRTLFIDVLSRQAEGSNGNMVGSEFISCDPGWRPSLFLQQFPHQFQRCPSIPPGLYEKIEDLAFVVDGTPKPMTPPSNDDDHLIEMPIVAGSWSHTTQVSSDRRTKFNEPAPHALVGNIQAPFRKQILHISITQSEAGIEPNSVANDIRWKSMACEGDVSHRDRLPQMPVSVLPVNVTMPRRYQTQKCRPYPSATGLIHHAWA
jgi:hypothetical protein